jgi:hypothetical protein
MRPITKPRVRRFLHKLFNFFCSSFPFADHNADDGLISRVFIYLKARCVFFPFVEFTLFSTLFATSPSPKEMACRSTSVEHVIASDEASASRVPTFSFQEFHDLVSSALDKDMSFSPTLSSVSHTLSPESRPLPVLPYYKRPRGFLQKLKNRVFVFKRRARVHDTVAAAATSHFPSRSTQRLPFKPLSPLLSAPLVRFQSRSTSHRSFAPSDSSFASSSTSTCEIKRTILTQFKLSTFRSHSKTSSSVSRRTISNPSPVPSSSLGCLSDFKTVRDLDTFDLDLEHPRQAPRPPTVSHSQNTAGRNSFYFQRELESPEFNSILLEQVCPPSFSFSSYPDLFWALFSPTSKWIRLYSQRKKINQTHLQGRLT